MEQIGLEGIFDLTSWDKSIDSYIKSTKRAENETQGMAGKLGKAYDDMGRSVLNAATVMGKTFVAAAVAAGAAVGAFVASGISKAADLESQMGAIAAVMGETKDAVGPLKDLILDLGMDPMLKVNAQEAADAIEKLASNGLTMTQVMDGAAKATVLLANSTDADFGTAAAIATDAMVLFNIEAADMMEAVNGITGVTVSSKFDINDYRLALAQAGGVASATGVSFDDFNTSITGMANLFASGSDAGTSFKTMLLRLVPSTAAAAEAMGDIGLTTTNAGAALEYLAGKGVKPVSDNMDDLYNQVVDVYYATNDLEVGSEEAAEKFGKWAVETGLVQSAFYDANGQMKDMDEISALLNQSLAGLSEQEKSKALNTIFGTDAMRAAVGLAEQGEVAYTDQALAAKELGVSYDSLTEAMEGGLTKFEALSIQLGNTDAAEAAKVRMDNFKGSMEILQGVIDTVALKIGFAFLPMLKAMADRLSEFVTAHADQITGFFEGFAGAIETLVSGASWREIFPTWLTTTIALVAENMDILTGALGGIAALLASAGIAAAFSAIGVTMAGLLSPMALLIGGAAALGVAWNTNFLGIKDATLAVLDPITNYIATIADAGIVSSEAREALTLFPEALQPIIGGFMDTIAGIQFYISAVMDAGTNSTEAAEALTVFPEALQVIAKAVLDTVLGITGYIAAIRDAGAFSIEAREALTLLPEALQGIVGGFTETLAAIGNYVSVIADAGVGSTEAQEALGLLTNSFGNLVSAVAEQLPIWQAQLTQWGAALVQWIADATPIALSKLGEWATALIGALAANLPTWIAAYLEWSAGMVTWIGDAIAGGITALGEWAGALVGWLTGEGKTQIGGGALLLVGALIDWIANDLIPKVAPAMLEYGAALGGALLKIAAALGIDAVKIGTAIMDAIMTTDYKSIGVNILTYIRDGWNTTASAVLTVVAAFATNVKAKFDGIDWKAIGTTILTYIRDGWEATKATVLTGLGVIVTSFKERFGETANNWTAAGKDILDKVRAGIESAKETALATITTVVADMRRRYVTPDGFAWGTIGTDIMNAIRDGLQQAAQAAGGILATVVTVATFIKDQFTKQSWDEIGATIMNAIRDGLDAAAKAAGGLLVVVKNIGMDLMKTFTEINWEEVGRTMARLLKDGFKALAEGAGGLLPTAKSVGTGVFDAFADIDWLELGRTIIAAVGAGVKAVAYAGGGLISIVAQIVEGFTEELFSVDWQTLGGDIIVLVQDGIEGARTAILNSVRTLLLDMKKIFTDLADTWKTIGIDIVNGIGAGITAAKDSLIKKAQDLANSLPGWVQSVLGISSPSKVFAEIGRNVVEGLIVGIEQTMPTLQKTMLDLSSSISIEKLIKMDIQVSSAFSDMLQDKYLQPLLDLNNSIKTRQSELQKTLDALHTEYFGVGVSDGRKLEIVSMINQFTQELTNLAKSDVSGKLKNLQQALNWGNQARDTVGFLESQVALMQEAKKLGISVSGVSVNDRSVDNLTKMAAIEYRIAEIRRQQLTATAHGLQMQTETVEQLERHKNLRDAIAHVEKVSTFMSDQLALMKKAEGLGLNLSQLWSGGIIRDSSDMQRILSLQLHIASAAGMAMENQMETMIVEQRRAQGLEKAMRQLQPLIDQTNVSSAFGQKYKAEVLDPMLRALQQSAGIDAERVRLMNEYTAAAQKLIEINKKEDQLGFLQKQLDIVKMIADQDIVGGASLFDGIAFGVNASIDDLLTLTNRVLNAMITEVRDELGIHSPSRVFADIGSQMMNGLSQGIQRSFVQPLNALRQSTVAHGAVSTRTLNFAMGGVTINTPMDEVRFESRVLRILERSMN